LTPALAALATLFMLSDASAVTFSIVSASTTAQILGTGAGQTGSVAAGISLTVSGSTDAVIISGSTATLKVTAEHAALDLLRSTPTLYSDSEQRRLASNDPSLQFMADQVEMRIVWPAASWKP
jgi:hypothetical protein